MCARPASPMDVFRRCNSTSLFTRDSIAMSTSLILVDESFRTLISVSLFMLSVFSEPSKDLRSERPKSSFGWPRKFPQNETNRRL